MQAFKQELLSGHQHQEQEDAGPTGRWAEQGLGSMGKRKSGNGSEWVRCCTPKGKGRGTGAGVYLHLLCFLCRSSLKPRAWQGQLQTSSSHCLLLVPRPRAP